ncbi:MAG: dephospho-CoA kinase [Candidatus Omnitrophica bacterium]|nr:dephospho-CoA kinase [Candidatus Omnitrophota bacterium]
MPVIGVTGSFGSGKSTVAAMFGRQGALVFDADQVIHDLLKVPGPVLKAVVKVFGPQVLSGREIDRVRLAKIVFDSPKKLQVLMAILHPAAKRQALKFIRLNRGAELLVLDVPLLLESGWDTLVDAVVVVKAAQKQQLERILKRSGTSRAQSLKRIRLQMPLRKKIKLADYVVDNSGSQSDTNIQVKRIIRELQNS